MKLFECRLCPHRCRIPEGGTGFCRVRGVREGHVAPLYYGRIASLALDPIEKKPLSHYHPGSTILSVGTFGCNLDCVFCQNASISRDFLPQDPLQARTATPEQLVSAALSLVPKGNLGLAYTYSEPLVNYEFVRDTARAIHKAGLRNVLVTNGYLCPDPFDALLPLIDAANIDVKSFTEDFYSEVCRAAPAGPACASSEEGGSACAGALACVMRNLESAVRHGVHVEATYLVLDGRNDEEEPVYRLAQWLSGIRRDLPLHITRCFPRRFDLERIPTPVDTLERLAAQARRCLDEVSVGNI